jgi:hypothetical protein
MSDIQKCSHLKENVVLLQMYICSTLRVQNYFLVYKLPHLRERYFWYPHLPDSRPQFQLVEAI